MSDNDIVLSVKNVSKCFEMYAKPSDRLKQMLFGRFGKQYYKEFWALRDINFEVRRGECVGIIGRNGAGKSTLLQIITGTLSPTTGTVDIRGRVAALLELGSGFNPEFTGRENVYLNGSILGLTRKEIDARFDEIVAFADIGEFIDQPVKTYSSGMMVRLAFAVISHVDADVLIVDEALSVGDAFFQQKCMRYMREFMKEHTVLFVSHDTNAVVNFCQRGVLLEHGCVKKLGVAKDVVQQYLKDLYSDQQEVEAVRGEGSVDPAPEKVVYRDMRADLINNSNLRNDLKVFEFDPKVESFGAGGVSIKSVRLCDANGASCSWIVGGEVVRLIVECRANKDLYSPIVGFLLRDRLGQNLFGDNTYLSFAEHPIAVAGGRSFKTEFEFQMPYLSPGDYSVCVAIAEGTQEKHVQHQWMNEALMFTSQSSHQNSGLIGIPMHKIDMKVQI